MNPNRYVTHHVYLVAKLDTTTLKVVECGLFSQSATSMSYCPKGFMHIDVFAPFSGETYDAALTNAIEYLLSEDLCPSMLRWVIPMVLLKECRTLCGDAPVVAESMARRSQLIAAYLKEHPKLSEYIKGEYRRMFECLAEEMINNVACP